MSMTRRSFALAAVGGAVLPALPAAAKAPAAGAQAAGIYRVKVGTIEVTVLNDGSAALPTKYLLRRPGRRRPSSWTPRSRPGEEMAPTTFNEWLINTGDKLVLVDTGYSTGAGPMAGKLPEGPRGRRPSIPADDRCRRHHPHPPRSLQRPADHPTSRWRFPTRPCTSAPTSSRSWLEGDVKVPGRQALLQGPVRGRPRGLQALMSTRKRVQTFKDGAELAPGVTAVVAPGHTVGHTMVRVADGAGPVAGRGPTSSTARRRCNSPSPSASNRLRSRTAAGDRDPQEGHGHGRRPIRLLIAGTHIGFPGRRPRREGLVRLRLRAGLRGMRTSSA